MKIAVKTAAAKQYARLTNKRNPARPSCVSVSLLPLVPHGLAARPITLEFEFVAVRAAEVVAFPIMSL